MVTKRIIRVFPRRTRATPDDALAFVGSPDLFTNTIEADEVHISVTWTWDLPLAEWLAKEWQHVAPVTIGGPATGQRGEDFVPGMYVKRGYVITSRGCPNRCWFCSVWRRDGNKTRELPIRDGWNVLDDNLLACSEAHIRSVFAMLARQKTRTEFTGGIEAKRLQPWIASELYKLNPQQIFFAYDTASDFPPLVAAGGILREAGFKQFDRRLRCYVLCGFPGDTITFAEGRLHQTLCAGFIPMAMLYRDEKGDHSQEWRKFQREWARPAIIFSKIKQSNMTSG